MADPVSETTPATDGWDAFDRVCAAHRVYRAATRDLIRIERALWFGLGMLAVLTALQIKEWVQ